MHTYIQIMYIHIYILPRRLSQCVSMVDNPDDVVVENPTTIPFRRWEILERGRVGKASRALAWIQCWQSQMRGKALPLQHCGPAGTPGVSGLGHVLSWPCGQAQDNDLICCTWKSLASKRFMLVFTGM